MYGLVGLPPPYGNQMTPAINHCLSCRVFTKWIGMTRLQTKSGRKKRNSTWELILFRPVLNAIKYVYLNLIISLSVGIFIASILACMSGNTNEQKILEWSSKVYKMQSSLPLIESACRKAGIWHTDTYCQQWERWSNRDTNYVLKQWFSWIVVALQYMSYSE